MSVYWRDCELRILDQLDRYDALSDGLLFIRHLFGLHGASLIHGAVAAGASRTTSVDIEAYRQSLAP